jgi:membrane protein
MVIDHLDVRRVSRTTRHRCHHAVARSPRGRYNETYGALGAVVVVILWLRLSALVVILGAELNCELERQTVRDTTQGPDRPLGSRHAYAADTVGPPRTPPDGPGRSSGQWGA